MKYSKTLKELFIGITLNTEDLFLLETFQIKYLPDRVPKKNLLFYFAQIQLFTVI